ncbi:hypothetical protein EA25_16650 [Vibrio navarrensis]|nr:hypothetical protein EA25_16650 [Vibrio navarrensis]
MLGKAGARLLGARFLGKARAEKWPWVLGKRKRKKEARLPGTRLLGKTTEEERVLGSGSWEMQKRKKKRSSPPFLEPSDLEHRSV